MAKITARDGRALAATLRPQPPTADPPRIVEWLDRLRDRLTPTQYVDGRDVPDELESPYRARVTRRREPAPQDVETGEREIVAGEMKIVYEVRCSCGKRWFNTRLENVQICPRCDRAVLLRDPRGPAPAPDPR